MIKVRTRIAPSPTGSPHIGTAYAALFNFVFAKQNKGDFILRIEDTDRSRYVEGSEEEIYEALSWLGLDTDEDPKKGGNFGPYRQSERLNLYKENLQILFLKEKAYRCDCTVERLTKLRKEQQAKGEIPHYDRKCRFNRPKSEKNTVIRLAVPLDGETEVEDLVRGRIIFKNSTIDDQVLLKSDGFPTYHLASVVDDHLMKISHVIRAEEWLSSTPKHVLLYQAFGWEIPVFAHLPLLRNPDKSKISKRKNPVSIDFYRREGYLPEALLNFLALMGWSMPNSQEIFSKEEMIKNFTFDRVGTVGPVFDIQKLNWLNGEYIRKLKNQVLARRIEPLSKYDYEKIIKVLPLIKDRLKKLSEFDNLTSYLLEKEIKPNLPLLTTMSGHSLEATVLIMRDFVETSKKISHANWKKEVLEKIFGEKPKEFDWSKTSYFQTIRTAVSGTNQTPPLFEILEKIGKDWVIERVEKTILQLKKLSD